MPLAALRRWTVALPEGVPGSQKQSMREPVRAGRCRTRRADASRPGRHGARCVSAGTYGHAMTSAADPPVFRSWAVDLGGQVHWTVVDQDYDRHREADAFLLHLRFAADAAEGTARAYAGDVALFLTWVGSRGDLLDAARRLPTFMAWLRMTPIPPGRRSAGQVRSPRRQQRVLVAVREFYRFCAFERLVDPAVLATLYEVADDRHLPAHLKPEGAGLRYVARPRHRVRVPRSGQVDVCQLEEFEALLTAAGNWRDRFLLVLLWFTGLRIGQALGLCREDLHLGSSSRRLGCSFEGAHVHVVRRENSNGARSKSRHDNVVPLGEVVIAYFEQYHALRSQVPAARENPLLFVNVAKNAGAGMTPAYAEDLFQRLSRKAQIRRITPHMLRHSFATTVRRGGAPLDVVQALLGHASIESTMLYNHATLDDMRRAVAQVPVPSAGR